MTKLESLKAELAETLIKKESLKKETLAEIDNTIFDYIETAIKDYNCGFYTKKETLGIITSDLKRLEQMRNEINEIK